MILRVTLDGWRGFEANLSHIHLAYQAAMASSAMAVFFVLWKGRWLDVLRRWNRRSVPAIGLTFIWMMYLPLG
jgi:hypothetical protein